MRPVQRCRTKICGITSAQAALDCADSGADAIGLVFYPPSPRAVTIEQAAEIVAKLPAFVTAVGLFVDAEPGEVRAVLDGVRLDLLQFHGDETPAYCEQFPARYIKAIRMHPDLDVTEEINRHGKASGVLLDAWSSGQAGGTGKQFDWSRVPRGLDMPIVLAGGLGPDTVAEAISTVRPYAVDVSSGVESSPGIKDPTKVRHFIQNAWNSSHD